MMAHQGALIGAVGTAQAAVRSLGPNEHLSNGRKDHGTGTRTNEHVGPPHHCLTRDHHGGLLTTSLANTITASLAAQDDHQRTDIHPLLAVA